MRSAKSLNGEAPGIPVVENRWVKCRFCEQTFITGQGDRCSLCSKEGGLVEVPPPGPSPNAVDQKSWAIPEGPDGGTSLAAGCFTSLAAGCLLIIMGAVVGAGIAYMLPEARIVEKPSGRNLPLAGLEQDFNFFARVFAGALVGAVCGGLATAVVLILLPGKKARRGKTSG